LVGNLRDGNVSRNVQQSTTKINNQGNLQQKYVSFLEKRACGPTKTKIDNTNNGTNKQQRRNRPPIGKRPYRKKLAAQRSKAMEPKVSLHDGDGNGDSTSGIEEAAQASGLTTDKEEGSIQSNKDSKRKSPPTTSIQSYRHTKRPKKLLSSEKSNKQRTAMPDHKKIQKAARPDTDDSTGSEKGDSDEDYENRKQSATTSLRPKTNQQNIVGDRTQSPAELRAVLIETKGQLERAERQVRAISKTRVADTFLEGQVRTWTKETLWKMCKFITNDQTTHKVMNKASKHFKVLASEQQHWKASYVHIVRDGLNQK
jgi:hypothetical protein